MTINHADRDPTCSRVARAVALVLATAATQAIGQQAPAPATTGAAAAGSGQELEEIVVTGYRASLRAQVEIKRESATSVDAILAEDIADFPDQNLAEAIQRIPGVAIDRVAGEGKQITVRGLGADFTRVRINGMEALATTSATDSVGTNRGRGFDFNVFAAELFNSISVQKTSAAETDEGSLGATIDLRTARPLDYDGPAIAASYQQGYNSNSESWDPRITALGSWLNDDGNFGALISLAYTNREFYEDGSQSGGWERNTNSGRDRWQTCPACKTPAELAAVDNAVHARFPRYVGFEHTQERLGITGSLQWRPTDAMELTFDVLYSNLDATRSEPFIEAISFARGGTGCTAITGGRCETDVLGYEIDSNGTMVYGRFDDVDVRSESRLDEWSTQFTQYSLSFDYEVAEDFRIYMIAGTSESKLNVDRQTTLILENFNSDGYSYDFRGNDTKPVITYGFDTTDPANWKLSEVRERPSTNDNGFDTFALSTAFDFNDALTLKTGLSWKRFDFDIEEFRRDRVLPLTAPSSGECRLAKLPVTADDGRVIDVGQDEFFLLNVRSYADKIGLYTDDPCWALVPNVGNTRSVVEEDFGVFLQLDFSTEIAGMPFRGNAGVRYVETDMESKGIQVVGNPPVNEQISAGNTYDDVLPAVNLVLEPVNDVLLRAAYAKVMTRPGLGNLTPGGSLNGFATPPTVTSGNPALEPFRADSYDVSVEWYYGKGGLLAAAYFWKQIDSFVNTVRVLVPWAELGLPDSLLDQVPADPDDIFQVNYPDNGDGGDLDGFEIQWQQPFEFFGDSWLRNFGLLANYTHVESDLNYGTATAPIIRPLNGLSEDAYNATFYYDDTVFMARISYSYRDQYQTAAVSVRPGNDIEYTEEYASLDFSTSYRIGDHLKLSFEAINLTDEYRIDRFDTVAGRMNNYLGAGTQYFFGVQYTY